jgi:hypothetical protein
MKEVFALQKDFQKFRFQRSAPFRHDREKKYSDFRGYWSPLLGLEGAGLLKMSHPSLLIPPPAGLDLGLGTISCCLSGKSRGSDLSQWVMDGPSHAP